MQWKKKRETNFGEIRDSMLLRLLSWGLNVNDDCVLWRGKESRLHLVFECSLFRLVWQMACSKNGISTGTRQLNENVDCFVLMWRGKDLEAVSLDALWLLLWTKIGGRRIKGSLCKRQQLWSRFLLQLLEVLGSFLAQVDWWNLHRGTETCLQLGDYLVLC